MPDMNGWHAIDTEPQRNGASFGDNQAADNWGVRLRNDALPNAVVDVDYCAEFTRAEEEGDDPEYAVTGMIHFTVCDDPDDPGGTETWADIEYDYDADPLGYTDLAEADQAAKFQAQRWIWDAGKFLVWDGQPFSR